MPISSSTNRATDHEQKPQSPGIFEALHGFTLISTSEPHGIFIFLFCSESSQLPLDCTLYLQMTDKVATSDSEHDRRLLLCGDKYNLKKWQENHWKTWKRQGFKTIVCKLLTFHHKQGKIKC